MTLNFIDTSALLKLFIDEVGSEAMVSFSTAQPRASHFLSALSAVEYRSALSRLLRTQLIAQAEAVAVHHQIRNYLSTCIVEPISARILDLAASLVERNALRTLDAIHLATALVLRHSHPMDQVRFISSDTTLLQAATAEGLTVWNPTQS